LSFDFFTPRICPHEVAYETLTLDASDRRVAPFLRPPSNSQIHVFLDNVEVPRAGLYSYATLPFSRPEPYRIKKGVNDLLYLSVGFDAPQMVQLIPGSVSARDLARDLQLKFPDLYVDVVNRRTYVRSRTASRGTAFQLHDPRWTDTTSSLPTTARILAAYSTLGIVPGRAAVGRLLVPGWSVKDDPADPLLRNKLLVFSSELKNDSPLVQVSYVTSEVDCRRCHGTRIEFDYQIENNSYAEVRDTDLLAQEFDKFLFTKIGSHWKWNWLGSKLVDRIGGKGSTGQVSVNTVITVDISQAFSTYQNIKSQQDSKFPQQKVSDAEYPQQLAGINVQTLPQDPTVAIVTTTVVSRSQVDVPLKRLVGDPNPFTLAGDPETNIRLQPGQTGFRLRG